MNIEQMIKDRLDLHEREVRKLGVTLKQDHPKSTMRVLVKMQLDFKSRISECEAILFAIKQTKGQTE